MAAQTKAEVRDRAAQELGILQLGQSLQDQDRVRIEQAYDEVYQELKVEGLATWASTGSVPAELVPHVADLVAHNCMLLYGISDQRASRLLSRTGAHGDGARREIRRLVALDYSSQEDPPDY